MVVIYMGNLYGNIMVYIIYTYHGLRYGWFPKNGSVQPEMVVILGIYMGYIMVYIYGVYIWSKIWMVS